MNGMIEYFGTAASVIVAISLTQKNIKKLRILNLIGAAAFAVYGLFIMAWPVFGLNAFIAVIDVYYLIEMSRRKNYFELLNVDNPTQSVYVNRFLEFYMEDIKKFIPSFKEERLSQAKAVFILRDLLPVSLVMYIESESEIEIIIDYAIPAYRDMKNASFFLEKTAEIFNEGNAAIVTDAGSSLHNKYLEKAGFSYSDEKLRYIYRQ